MNRNKGVRALVLISILISSSVLAYHGDIAGEIYATVVTGILGLFHRGMEDTDGQAGNREAS